MAGSVPPVGVALLFSVVYLLAGEHIIALLTSLTQIQQLADRYLIWQVILPLVGVWCYLLDGMFIGATRAAEMRNSYGGGRRRFCADAPYAAVAG